MKKLILILAIFTVGISACQKFEPIENETDINGQNENKTLENAVVEDSFDWKTTKDIDVKITGNVDAVLYIKSTDDKVFEKAMLLSGASYITKLTVPSYEKQIILEYGGQTRSIGITNNQIEYNFN